MRHAHAPWSWSSCSWSGRLWRPSTRDARPHPAPNTTESPSTMALACAVGCAGPSLSDPASTDRQSVTRCRGVPASPELWSTRLTLRLGAVRRPTCNPGHGRQFSSSFRSLELMESSVRCTLIGRCSESFAVKVTRPRPGAAYLHHVADAVGRPASSQRPWLHRINDRRAAGGRRRPTRPRRHMSEADAPRCRGPSPPSARAPYLHPETRRTSPTWPRNVPHRANCSP